MDSSIKVRANGVYGGYKYRSKHIQRMGVIKRKANEIKDILISKCKDMKDTHYTIELYKTKGYFLINKRRSIIIRLIDGVWSVNKKFESECSKRRQVLFYHNIDKMDTIDDLIKSIDECVPGNNSFLNKSASKLETFLPRSEKWFRNLFQNEWFFGTLGAKYSVPLNGFIYDVYIKKFKVVIEIDGSIHDLEEVKIKDERKDKLTKETGYKVIRIKAHNIESYKTGMETLLNIVKNKVQRDTEPSPNVILRKST
jgi:very-short-patch-repair endonuclease